MKYLKITTAILAAVSLSGCLGSNSDKVAKAPVDEPPIVVEVVPATFAEKSVYLAGIKDIIDTGRLADLPTDFIPPTQGTANYAGVMVLPDPHRDGSMIGDSYSTIDFVSGLSTGEAGNFTNELDEVWTGTLASAGDFISASTITGTLSNEASGDTEIDGKVELVDMDSYASWANIDNGVAIPEYTYGHITGTATTDGVETVLNEDNAYYYGELVD